MGIEYDMQANGQNGVLHRTEINVLPAWDSNQKGVLLVGGDAQASLPSTDIVGIVATGNQNGTGMLAAGGVGPGVVGLAGMNGIANIFNPRSDNPHDFLVHQFGVFGFAGTDGTVHGNPNTECGVYGESQDQGNGVRGFSDKGVGVFGSSGPLTGIGVSGDGPTVGVQGTSSAGIGVSGDGPTVGVQGTSSAGTGISGDGPTVGVQGTSSAGIGVSGDGPTLGVDGTSKSGDGIHGSAASGVGVYGASANKFGVIGRSAIPKAVTNWFTAPGSFANVGVTGMIGSQDDPTKNVPAVVPANAVGVYGAAAPAFTKKSPTFLGLAGRFDGPVVINNHGFSIGLRIVDSSNFPLVITGLAGTAWFDGGVTATGAKSAAVPHPDGSHRRLYSLECPESWFEDFGGAKLTKGKATVALDPDFGAVVNTRGYHVFLTPYGDSNGLYVSHQTPTGFEVREQNRGTSSIRFSYRVVAKRKDLKAERLAKVTLPTPPTVAPQPKRRIARPKKVK